MFSWNRHGQEKSHGAAFLSRRSSKPCAKRPLAWKGCSEGEIHRCRLAQQSFAFHSRVFRFRTCAERCAELGRLSVGILVLSCVQRGAWAVRSFGDRSSLVAQHKTYPLFFPAGEEILSKSKKTYRIVLARHPVVCRSRCTVSLDRHSVLNHARPVQCGFCSDGTASRKAGADDHLCKWL